MGGEREKTLWRRTRGTNSCITAEDETHLSEYGHADVVVAGFVDELSQLVWRDRSSDGFLSGFRREAHGQVLLVRQQIRAGLRRDGNQSDKSSGNIFPTILVLVVVSYIQTLVML